MQSTPVIHVSLMKSGNISTKATLTMLEGFSGLSTSEASARLKSEGRNELPRTERRTGWRIVLEVLREPMFALLMAGGAIYLALGNPHEALILLVFATLSVSIAVVQDFRSERVLEALRSLASPRALVIRDGRQIRIAGTDVVRGDIIIVGEGDRVAADAIIRVTTDLRVDEAALTGESVPVSKRPTAEKTYSPGRPGGDGSPHIFAGTLVVGGNGIAEVTATGARSQIGAIGASLGAIQVERPRLEKQMRRLVRVWAVLGVIASLAAMALYVIMRGGWLDGLLAGIALGMTMLPEEFPLIYSVFMVMGAWRISRTRVLTRRASAIEYLGSASVLCTDKTGTLTRNQMEVVALATENRLLTLDVSKIDEPFAEVISTGALACPPTTIDPMERAILATAAPFGAPAGTLLKTYGLKPSLMAMSQVWRGADGVHAIAAKGAVEAIARLCRLDTAAADKILAQTEGMARQGMRVLGVARATSPVPPIPPEDPLEIPFTFVGLIGLSDPLRPEVPAAIAECASAGIRVVMITGDYPATAVAIAKQAGIPAGTVITGPDLEAMDEPQLRDAVRAANVCARITPLQKLRVVNALKANGDVVAMTGDGVNDAPSLKAADIGVAMGGRGTDVAREAAAIVLLDDDFTSIVRTIRLGRRIYDNLRKAISFVIAVHILIAGLALIPLAFGLPLLLFPVHIAFLEMIIDPVCSLAFEAEQEESDIMRRPPRPLGQPLFTPEMLLWAILQGGFALGLVVTAYVVALDTGVAEQEARAGIFVALVAANIGLTLINRSFHRRSIFAIFARANRVLWIVFGIVAVALAGVLSWAPLRGLFRFDPLEAKGLLLAAAIGVAVFVVLNVAKMWAPLARKAARERRRTA